MIRHVQRQPSGNVAARRGLLQAVADDVVILIAIGANLPDGAGRMPLATCRMAAEALRNLPGLRFVAMSPWYATEPVPHSDQPDYVNGMVRLQAEQAPDPARLLARLHAIETRCGRSRGAADAARILDLDIVAIDDLIRVTPDPVLPHPRAHLRRFVLEPLRDVAPDWVHPVLGLTVAGILAELPPGGIRRL